MNPFDLSGPAFLVFYICLALIVVIALKLAIDEAEGGAPRALPLSDPYQIAWLRGGTPEAARIAVLSLTDRGLLAVSGDNLVNSSHAQPVVREPIESAILARCRPFGTAATPSSAILGSNAPAHPIGRGWSVCNSCPMRQCEHSGIAGSPSPRRSCSASLSPRSLSPSAATGTMWGFSSSSRPSHWGWSGFSSTALALTSATGC